MSCNIDFEVRPSVFKRETFKHEDFYLIVLIRALVHKYGSVCTLSCTFCGVVYEGLTDEIFDHCYNGQIVYSAAV